MSSSQHNRPGTCVAFQRALDGLARQGFGLADKQRLYGERYLVAGGFRTPGRVAADAKRKSACPLVSLADLTRKSTSVTALDDRPRSSIPFSIL